MFTAVLKAFAVAGLIIALFWRSPNYEALLSFLVCVAALVVVGQAIQIEKLHLDRVISSGLRAF
jgi:hypothetical protein